MMLWQMQAGPSEIQLGQTACPHATKCIQLYLCQADDVLLHIHAYMTIRILLSLTCPGYAVINMLFDTQPWQASFCCTWFAEPSGLHTPFNRPTFQLNFTYFPLTMSTRMDAPCTLAGWVHSRESTH